MKKYCGLLLSFWMLFTLFFSTAVSANDSITLKVGVYENSPKIFTDEQGNPSGFWPDIIEYLAAEEKWEIEYVPGTWLECLDRLENNEIDMLPDVAYTEERSQLYDFSNETVLVSWSRVYSQPGAEVESILDLEGKTIAVLGGSVNVEGREGIKDLVKDFDINCTFIEVSSYTEVFELLESRAADAGVTNKDFGNKYEHEFDVERTPIIFLPSRLHFAFPKDASLTPYLIERVDYHIKGLSADEDSVYYQSLEQWLAAQPVERRVIPEWIIWALISVGGLALLLAMGSLILRSRVRSRTRELTEEVIERKGAEAKLQESEDLLNKVCNITKIGGWEMDLITRQGKWTKGLYDIVEIDYGEPVPGPDEHIDYYLPEYRQLVQESMKKLIEEDIPLDFEAKFQTVKGKIKWCHVLGESVRENGECVKVFGTVQDITEIKQTEAALRESEEKYRNLVERANDGVCIIQDNRVKYCNQRVAELWGGTVEEVIDTLFTDFVHPDSLEKVALRYKQRLAGENVPPVYEAILKRRDDTRVFVELNAGLIQYEGKPADMAIIRDITERKQAEVRIQQYNRSLRVLSLCNQTLVRSSDEQQLLDEICGIVLKEGGYRLAWVGFAEDDEAKTVRPVSHCGFEGSFLDTVDITWADTERGRGPTSIAIRTGQPSIVRDFINDPAYAPWRELALKQGYASAISLPLTADNHTFGALSIFAAEPDAFDQAEIDLLVELANDLVFGITALRDRQARDRAEERLRTYLENAPDGVIITSAQDGSIIYGNHRAEEISGYKKEELAGQSFLDLQLIAPDYMAKARSMLQKNALGKPTGPDEYEIIRKDGNHICVEISATPVSEDGSYAVIGILRDITERKRSEDKLAESEQLYASIANNSPTGVYIVQDGTFAFANRRFCELTGYNHEELVGRHSLDLVYPEDRELVRQNAIDMLKGISTHAFEYRSVTKDGQVRDILESVSSIHYHGKLATLGSYMDITERKKMEKDLRRSEANLAASQRLAKIGSWERDIATGASAWSAELYDVNGFEPATEPPDFNEYLETVHPEDRQLILDTDTRVISTGESVTFEHRSNPARGPLRYFLANVELLVDDEGLPVTLIGTQQDITERKQAEEALRQSEEKLRTTLESIPEGVTVTDLEGIIIQINNAVLRMHGYDTAEEILGQSSLSLIVEEEHAEAIEGLQNTLNKGQSGLLEYTFLRKDGTRFPGELSAAVIRDTAGNPVGFVAITGDISERKQMEERLIMTDRLASVGELASGIAHELNNPLTSVIGFSQLLLSRDVPQDIKEDLDLMHREAQRAADVVKNLLTFARKHTYQKQPVCISDIIDKVLQLRAYEHNVSNINVVTHFATDLPEITADYFQLQQVFLNIVVNAEYFMIEAHNGGKLEITTEMAGNMVRACFNDDGPGIAKEVLPHLFDPFFTTKDVGKGTGLGLSICHGIITGHGGRIYAKSEEGKGATFVVELPLNNND